MPLPGRYICLLDKERGPTSFHYVSRLRRAFQLKRIGHAGTLDPFATGLMIYALGPACAALQFMEKLDKCYELTAVFGRATETYDSEGAVVEELPPELLAERLATVDIDAALKKLCGHVRQTVPKYAAIKRDGKALYAYARAGEEVELPERDVQIELLSRSQIYERAEGPAIDLLLRVSKGTYIRSFVSDLGQETRVLAYCQELRRTAVGSLELSSAIEPQQLFRELERWPLAERVERAAAAGLLTPIEKVLADYPRLALSAQEALDYVNGKPLPVLGDSRDYAVYYEDNILGICSGRGEERAKSLRVFYSGPELKASMH